jgi:hypothetical protein
MYKRLALAVALLAPTSTLAAEAEKKDVEQAYFEATVSRGKQVVNRPRVVVRLGADARISFGAPDGEGPRLGLKCRVDESPGGRLTGKISALVNDREVASTTLAFTRAEGASATLEGGGYTWTVSVGFMTEEWLERRRKERPRTPPSAAYPEKGWPRRRA